MRSQDPPARAKYELPTEPEMRAVQPRAQVPPQSERRLAQRGEITEIVLRTTTDERFED
jgi:hypothetical protein